MMGSGVRIPLAAPINPLIVLRHFSRGARHNSREKLMGARRGRKAAQCLRNPGLSLVVAAGVGCNSLYMRRGWATLAQETTREARYGSTKAPAAIFGSGIRVRKTCWRNARPHR